MGEGGLDGRRSWEGDEVGAHARLGVVKKWEDRARGRVAEAMPPADPVVRGDLTAEQLVKSYIEAPGKGHQRLEGDPPFSPLHLGDGAGGDPSEAGEIALAQIPAQAVGAQRRTDARRCLGRLQLQPSVLDGVAEQLALSSRWAPFGLADAQAALADDDNALGDLLDLAVHGPVLARPRHRPVSDRAEVEQHRAAVPEEATGDPHTPALG